MDHDTAPAARPATLAGWGLGLAVTAFVATALANVAWGWDGTAGALYGVGTVLLVVSLMLLVTVQLQLSRVHGGLGKAAAIGIGISALGAVLSFVSWAVVLWATVLGVGTLVFGAAVLRRGRVPRAPARALAFAMPAASALAWAGAVLSGGEDGSVVVTVAEVLVGAALLVLAWGVIGVGRWLASAEAERPAAMAGETRGTAYR